MSCELGFVVSFVVLFLTYSLVFYEKGSIKLGNLMLSIVIALMFASIWPLVLCAMGVAVACALVIGVCKLIEKVFLPVITRIGNIRVRVI